MNNTKFFIIVCSLFAASLTTFQSTIGMELSLPQKKQAYFNGCREIDNSQEQKLKKFLEWASATDFTFARQKIENKLQRLQEETVFEGKIFWDNIRKKYQISDAAWNIRMDLVKDMHDAESANKQWLKEQAKHDERIPADIFIMLKKYLHDYNMVDDEFTLQWHPTKALSYGATFNRTIEKDKKIMTITAPCHIMVAQAITLCSQKAKEGMCCILVNSLSDEKRLNLYRLTTLMKLDDFYPDSYKINIPENNREALGIANARLSETMLALKNVHNATIIEAYRKEFYQPEMSCLEYYKVLSKIKRLYKSLAWLKRYNISQTPLL